MMSTVLFVKLKQHSGHHVIFANLKTNKERSIDISTAYKQDAARVRSVDHFEPEYVTRSWSSVTSSPA